MFTGKIYFFNSGHETPFPLDFVRLFQIDGYTVKHQMCFKPSPTQFSLVLKVTNNLDLGYDT